MNYVNLEFKNNRAYLGVMNFKTKDQKYLGTLLIFTLISLTPKKCDLSISSREDKRMAYTHIHTISQKCLS